MSALRPSEAEALEDWRRLVEADAEQVGRVREDRDGADYYAPIAGRFRPGERDSAEWPALERLARPSDTWLDIGAGGGRFAVPLARTVERVVAIEPSPAMRSTLDAAATEAHLANIEVHDTRWPDAAWSIDADVSLAAHCLYDIGDVAPFLDAMERYTRRTCVAIFGSQARGAQFAALWEAVHGEPMATLPALHEFVALLAARDRRYDVTTVGEGDEFEAVPREQGYARARRFLWLAEGSEKDRRMCALMDRWYASDAPDTLAVPAARPYIGVVTWVGR